MAAAFPHCNTIACHYRDKNHLKTLFFFNFFNAVDEALDKGAVRRYQDLIIALAIDIIRDMNADHGDALVVLARV